MQPIDPESPVTETGTAVQTTATTAVNPAELSGLARFNAYHGLGITIYGILFVFIGIVIIQICMNLFNFYFLGRATKANQAAAVGTGKGSFDYVEKMPIPDTKEEPVKVEEVPEDDLIAIAAAIELYRRLHFDRLPSRITFTRGQDAQNAWQTGAHFGHRGA